MMLPARPRRVHRFLVLGLALAIVLLPAASAATLPGGFTETQVASGLASPTAMAVAPDGRIFVAEQGGKLRVIKSGALLATPFVSLTVNSVGERGLLGVAFDPAFASNGYVYVYYTATTPNVHNRVSRFTANGDVAAAGSEVVILELDPLTSATNHNGGALHFGPDGKLYIAVGDNANGANAQSLGTLHGKMLRINPDGSIPTDNPFYDSASGQNRAIWALGLRNPFTFSFQPGSSRMFINDVGENTWEEINDGIAGSNYGWPTTEGPTSDPRFRSPIYAYNHGSGCAITGGAFYNPATVTFPSEFVGDYFFADYCGGWIRKLDPANGNTVSEFAADISAPVDLGVTDDGSLLYLARGFGATTGAVYRISPSGGQAPAITAHPQSQTVSAGEPATFTVSASGSPPLQYQWQRDGVDIPGATSASYTLASAQAADDGARFRVRVSNGAGEAVSDEATLTVTANAAPTAAITDPASGSLYRGGDTIAYAGTGTDTEDGTLPASAFTWRVDFHHDTHLHPFLPPSSGARSGSFTVPTTGHTDANVWYRIHLTVTDSAGRSDSAFRDVLPRTSNVTLTTEPAGLELTLDGQPRTSPVTFTGVVGIERTIATVSPQTLAGTTYEFSSWSDGGARAHTISTPDGDSTYTATFSEVAAGARGLSADYYGTANLTGTPVTRTDAQVDFDWGGGEPVAGLGADTFSVRWTGSVEPPVTGTYTFYTHSDDGVRLWVDGSLVVDDWTDHALTEDAGTAFLTAGTRHELRMEFYESGGLAVARLLWSGPSTPKQVVPSSRLFPQAPQPPPPPPPGEVVARINFQPAASPVPAGYAVDSGLPFGLRANGERYGWSADVSAHTRDRDAANSPDQRYDTLVHLQKPDTPNATWEMAVPNGTYTVRLVAGDPQSIDSVFRLSVEGALALAGTPTPTNPWLEASVTATVADGRLTVGNAAGSANNKLCFVEIS
jgi:glucose/arabinose dehydrogenase